MKFKFKFKKKIIQWESPQWDQESLKGKRRKGGNGKKELKKERKEKGKKERKERKVGRGFVSWFTNDSNFKNGHNFDFLHLNWFSDFFFIFFFSFYFLFRFLFCFLAVFSSNGLRNPSTLIFDPATMKPEECHQSTSIYHYLQKKSFFHCCWSLDEGCNGKRKREKKWKKKKI